MPAKGWQTCDVTAEAFLWQVDRDPQFSGFGLLVATFFMLLSDNRRGVQSTRCHPFTLHHGQAWRRISGWEGDAPVTLQGMLKPSPYRKLTMANDQDDTELDNILKNCLDMMGEYFARSKSIFLLDSRRRLRQSRYFIFCRRTKNSSQSASTGLQLVGSLPWLGAG